MKDDLLRRLRQKVVGTDNNGQSYFASRNIDGDEAAAEIERLIAELAAERDALRALLREAREYTGYAAFYGDRIEADHAVDLCARIDAALNEGGGDE